MGLNGLSYEASKVAVDKMLMKSRYEEYGVRTARGSLFPTRISGKRSVI